MGESRENIIAFSACAKFARSLIIRSRSLVVANPKDVEIEVVFISEIFPVEHSGLPGVDPSSASSDAALLPE